jgi:hypothetical protein
MESHNRLTDRRERRLCRSRAALQMAITLACVGEDRWRTSAPLSVWTSLGEPAQSAWRAEPRSGAPLKPQGVTLSRAESHLCKCQAR